MWFCSISFQPFPDAAQTLKLSSKQTQAGDDYIRGAEAPPLPTEFPPLPDVKEPPYTKVPNYSHLSLASLAGVLLTVSEVTRCL